MSSRMKKAIGGSIHRIREFELEKVNLIDEFDILQIVGEGWFGKILLTEHRSTQTEMVLKALPKAYTGISDFFREFHYGLHLAAHRNIITTYDVAFETAGFYVFSQEYAPLGDLTSNVTETGLGELHAKRVARQLAAAVHHIHNRELVHRDIKLDNILVFRSDFSRIKLCDFGETRRVNTVVRRHNEWLPYSPPEVLQIDTDETYKALTSHDVWQFGIVLFVCLTGCLPWQKAALDDPRYTRYQNWHNATLNIAKKPKLFQLISSRAQRMFKRLLDPKVEKRPVSVLEVNKYLEDRWLAKLGAEKAINGGADERDELCPSMYSFHSSLEEKNQLLHTLTTYGIETTVDRSKKKDRIREWIQSSAIVEETEEDESDLNDDTVFYEDEDEEPASMKGRHFPERRPLAKSENKVKKRSEMNMSNPRKRLPVKPVERKIPFAPQVAEERETVARFASFPNGDPNLAIVANGINGNPNSGIKDNSNNTTLINRDTKDSVGNRVNSFPENYTLKNTTEIKPGNQYFKDNRDTTNRQEVKLDQTTPKSPQIPNRKHRSLTGGSGTPTSPRLDNNRSEQTRRIQEKPSTPIIRVEKLSTNSTSRKPPTTSSGMIRADSAPPAAMPMARLDNRSATSPVSRTDKAQPESQLVPVTYPINGMEGQTTQTMYTEKSNIPTSQGNPLTMSVASHLVMHSFNALQGMVPPSMPESAVNSPLNSPTVNSVGNSVGSSIANSTSTKQNRKEEQEVAPIIYGKDPYEHYGIAQSTVLRGEPVRQDSTGSGSRSVSN